MLYKHTLFLHAITFIMPFGIVIILIFGGRFCMHRHTYINCSGNSKNKTKYTHLHQSLTSEKIQGTNMCCSLFAYVAKENHHVYASTVTAATAATTAIEIQNNLLLLHDFYGNLYTFDFLRDKSRERKSKRERDTEMHWKVSNNKMSKSPKR